MGIREGREGKTEEGGEGWRVAVKMTTNGSTAPICRFIYERAGS